MFPSPRITLLPLTLGLALGAFAARGVLKADGIIRVKGAELLGVTVTVVPGHAASYGLPVGSRSITLDLPLDDVYLISVQRAGCPTKELYFDTRVPVEVHAKDFGFPFIVTLEYLPPEKIFAYAGPVGFVRYEAALTDFTYETNYAVQVEEDLKLRMREIQRTGVDPKIMAPPMMARVVDRPQGSYSAPLGIAEGVGDGTVAPMVSAVPRLVHVVHVVRAPDGQVRDRLAVLVPLVTSVQPLPLPMRVPAVAVVATYSTPPMGGSLRRITASPVTSAALLAVAIPVEAVRSAAAPGSLSRSDEHITEARWVMHIVRFSGGMGAVHEYRKVVHAFGGVYFFQDGLSITERAFEKATGVDVVVIACEGCPPEVLPDLVHLLQ